MKGYPALELTATSRSGFRPLLRELRSRLFPDKDKMVPRETPRSCPEVSYLIVGAEWVRTFFNSIGEKVYAHDTTIWSAE